MEHILFPSQRNWRLRVEKSRIGEIYELINGLLQESSGVLSARLFKGDLEKCAFQSLPSHAPQQKETAP